MADAKRDGNFVPTLLGTSNVDNSTPVRLWADPTTHRLLVNSAAAIASLIQTDSFTATNNQTAFTASLTVAATFYLSVNGAIQTPTTDYTVAAGVATLTTGVPAGTVVLWCYTTA